MRTTSETRVHWKEKEYEDLALWMIEHLPSFGIDPANAATAPPAVILKAIRRAMDEVLEEGRRRKIQAVSQLGWLWPLISPTGKKEDRPTRKKEGGRRRSDEYANLIRMIKRQNRAIKIIRSHLESLTDLMLEVVPQNAQTIQFTPPPCPIPTPKPVVAIAGLRRHQQQAVSRKLEHTAIYEFVDAEKRSPESLLDFDMVYCVRCTELKWKQRAHRVLKERFQEYHGTSPIVAAIEQLARSTV